MSLPVQHTSFTIERKLATSPGHAFRFWSDAELKARWNGCHPDWTVVEDRFDFRVGGEDRKRWQTRSGDIQTYTAHYLDIVPHHRIIYAYEMSLADVRLSASLVTILLSASGAKCRMVFTEQVAILAGGADAGQQRLAGTEEGIDRLGAIIAAEAALRA
jgi:uncharacterized protein YndB with AHSA1/START domain